MVDEGRVEGRNKERETGSAMRVSLLSISCSLELNYSGIGNTLGVVVCVLLSVV